MKKIIQALLICCCFLFVSCTYTGENKAQVIDENNGESTVYGENMTVSRALAAKMICCLFLDDTKSSKNNFFDVAEDMWYFDYANIVFENNIMVGNNGYFKPLEPITYLEAMKVIKRIGGDEVDYDAKNGDMPISYTLWCSMVEDTLEKKEKSIEYSEISIFATGNGEAAEVMTAVTDKGIYRYCGLWLESCKDKKIKAYILNNEIVFISDIVSEEGTFEGVNITNENDIVWAELLGVKRKFDCSLMDIKYGECGIKTKNGAIIEIL